MNPRACCRTIPFLLAGGFLLSVALRFATAGEQNPDSTNAERANVLKVFVSELIDITPGQGKFPKSFQMGSAKGSKPEQPVHKVTFTENFSIAKYEVPQNLYAAVMGKNPSRWQGSRNSAEMMTFNEARLFCRRITGLLREAKLIEAAEEIRLPTEAEWEYCCRSGTTTEYSFGESATKPGDTGKRASILDAYGWHTGNAAGNDPPVGVKKANAWGLYDMHGYLWEFVADAWHEDYRGAPTDGSAWSDEEKRAKRVLRSGSWRDRYELLRSAIRISVDIDFRSEAVGFRCVKALVKQNSPKSQSR